MKNLMKKRVLSIFLTILMVATLLPTTMFSAFAATEGEYEYELINNNTEVKITKYVGSGGNVYIPNKIAGKTVTQIYDSAFKNNKVVTYLWSGDNLVKIGANAFSGCTALANMDLGNGLKEIGSQAFYDCDVLLKAVIPNSVLKMDGAAFKNCDKLKEASIGNGLKAIESNAFSGCPVLEKVTFGNSIETIGYQAFNNCVALKEIKLPDSMVSMDDWAFGSCTALANMDLGNGLKEIGQSFENCDSLLKVVIPNSVIKMDGAAFKNCDKLKEASIGNGLKAIESNAFSGCPVLEKVTFGNSIETIGYQAFNNCVALKEIKLPDSMVSMDDWAFGSCTALANMDLGNGLKEIGQSFENCDSLLKVVIPDSVVKMDGAAFKNCDKLKEVAIGNGLKAIGPSTFSGCPVLEKVTFGNSIETIGYQAFNNCVALKEIKLPDSMVSMDDWAFGSCTALANMDLGNGLKEIGQSFENCDSLLKVVIPDSVVKMGGAAFKNCDKLKEVAIGNGLKVIESSTFYSCPLLEKVTFGNSVETIGQNAFYNCKALKSAYFLGNAPAIDSQYEGNDALNNANWYKLSGATGFSKGTVSTTSKTVTFNSNGGEEGTFSKIFDAGVISGAANPTRDGYTFIGWYQNANGTGNAFNFSKDTASNNITLYAKWQINTYRIFFDPRGGSNVTVGGKVVTFNEAIGTLPSPNLLGDTFEGWYSGINGTGPRYTASSKMPSKDIYLYASWAKNITATTVIFDTQGGNFFAPINATVNATVSKPNTPVRSGYEFIGWYKDAAHYTKWDFKNDTVTANTTIFANWKKSAEDTVVPAPPATIDKGFVTGNSITISWAAATGARGYNVYLNGVLNNTTQIAATSYSIKNLSPKTTYNITVKAVNNKGESATGKSISITTPAVLLGDVTGDGEINALDSKWILQSTIGARELTPAQKTTADVTGDGVINALDSKWILQYTIGA